MARPVTDQATRLQQESYFPAVWCSCCVELDHRLARMASMAGLRMSSLFWAYAVAGSLLKHLAEIALCTATVC